MARTLTQYERELLLHLLRHEGTGYAELRRQVELARYECAWFSESLSFDISLPPDAPRSSLPDGPHADGDWSWAAPHEPIGNFLLWIEGGHLAALEYGWVIDEMPTEYPDLSTVREPSEEESGAPCQRP